MCLIVTVRLAEPDALRAVEICGAAGIPACSTKRKLFGFSDRTSGILQIPGPEGGCGCSFLSDDANWTAATWNMDPAAVPRLAGILQEIRRQTTTGFTFEALWIGETATEERPVTIDELVRLAEVSQIGTRTSYRVA